MTWPFRKRTPLTAPTVQQDDAAELRALDAERRARDVRARAEKVARALEKRLRENHFAEGLGAAWGANGHHR